MSCKTKKSTRSNRRKNNNSDDLTAKDLLDTTVKVGLLGVTVGLVDKMR